MAMTTKEKLIDWLVNNGLSQDEAETVFERAKPEIERDNYRVTWNGPASAYPPALYVVWIMIIKRVALAYIDETCPQAWFRPMFTPDPEAEIARLEKVSNDKP